jgi:hypothetical protein
LDTNSVFLSDVYVNKDVNSTDKVVSSIFSSANPTSSLFQNFVKEEDFSSSLLHPPDANTVKEQDSFTNTFGCDSGQMSVITSPTIITCRLFWLNCIIYFFFICQWCFQRWKYSNY